MEIPALSGGEGAVAVSDDERSGRSGASSPTASWPEQFEQLYLEARDRVYRLAARLLGDPHDAADITQEVFLRAYTHPPAVREGFRPDAWLHRITVNACYDHLRRRQARAAAPLDVVGEIQARSDGFAAAETARAVEQALGAMSVRYRTALVLRDLHGLDPGEVAVTMGMSAASARVLLHRARRAFRRAFRDAAPAGAGTPGPALALILHKLQAPAWLLPPPVAALGPVPPASMAPVTAAGFLAKIAGGAGAKALTAFVLAATVATGGLVVEQTVRSETGSSRDPGIAASPTPAISPGGPTGTLRGTEPGTLKGLKNPRRAEPQSRGSAPRLHRDRADSGSRSGSPTARRFPGGGAVVRSGKPATSAVGGGSTAGFGESPAGGRERARPQAGESTSSIESGGPASQTPRRSVK